MVAVEQEGVCMKSMTQVVWPIGGITEAAFICWEVFHQCHWPESAHLHCRSLGFAACFGATGT